jgi:hypothetical protein
MGDYFPPRNECMNYIFHLSYFPHERSCGFHLFPTAERVRFELTVPEGTTVFETAAFDHSATSPNRPHFGSESDFCRSAAFNGGVKPVVPADGIRN